LGWIDHNNTANARNWNGQDQKICEKMMDKNNRLVGIHYQAVVYLD